MFNNRLDIELPEYTEVKILAFIKGIIQYEHLLKLLFRNRITMILFQG